MVLLQPSISFKTHLKKHSGYQRQITQEQRPLAQGTALPLPKLSSLKGLKRSRNPRHTTTYEKSVQKVKMQVREFQAALHVLLHTSAPAVSMRDVGSRSLLPSDQVLGTSSTQLITSSVSNSSSITTLSTRSGR